jgi:hypothetical protein
MKIPKPTDAITRIHIVISYPKSRIAIIPRPTNQFPGQALIGRNIQTVLALHIDLAKTAPNTSGSILIVASTPKINRWHKIECAPDVVTLESGWATVGKRIPDRKKKPCARNHERLVTFTLPT